MFPVNTPGNNKVIPLLNIFSSLVLRELIFEKIGPYQGNGDLENINFKWPNDVFYGVRSKLAGVKSLVEANGRD